MKIKHEMTQEQASRILTLAYYMKTAVDEKKFNQNFYARYSVKKVPAKPGPFDPECGTSACTLGYCTIVFPKTFRVYHHKVYMGQMSPVCFEVEMLIEGKWKSISMHSRDQLSEFFGWSPYGTTTYDVFGFNPMTLEEKAAQLEKIAGEYGWEYK